MTGTVCGHPTKADGHQVVTSPIRTSKGRLVTTQSGNVYELVGDPDPEYLAYLQSIGYPYDSVNPVKVRRARDAS